MTTNDWVGVTGREDTLADEAQICGVKTVTTRSWAGVSRAPAGADGCAGGLALGLVRSSGCNTSPLCSAVRSRGTISRCEDNQRVIVVLDPQRAQVDLAAAHLRCPGCTGPLRPWGYARARSLRSGCGAATWLRPRRARCPGCAVTHVLLPASAPARHAHTIDLIGLALMASAHGDSPRTISAEIAVPADTIRGWVRRATSRAGWLYAQGVVAAHSYDPMLAASVPGRSALADALEVLATAAAALVRLLGPVGTPWQVIAMIARGQLPAPLRAD